MPIISVIGRKSLKVRLLTGSIYVLLMAGAVTMVYPFLLMLSGSTKSDLDVKDSKIMPQYLADDEHLYQKHVEGLFNEHLEVAKGAYDMDISKFGDVKMPASGQSRMVADWSAFVAESRLPPYSYGLAYTDALVTKSVLPYLVD